MDGPTLISLAFRLVAYAFVFQIVSHWSWEEGKRPGPGRAIALAVLRMLAGAGIVWLLQTTGKTWPPELRGYEQDLVFVARLLVWTGLLGFFAGARTIRLAGGVFLGMLVNLAADFLFRETAVWGIPFYG